MADFRLTVLAALSLSTACQVAATSPLHPGRPVLGTAVRAGESLSPAALPAVTAWQPLAEDVQDLAEQIAPRVVLPRVDVKNPPVTMLYAPYTNGPLIGIRYFVQYVDEDTKSSVADKLYDIYRKQHYGSIVDIEPIEVFADADSHEMAGVAFKTGQHQDFYKLLVKENDWLTFPARLLTAADRIEDHPRIGVSTWNHLHDLPSVLTLRTYPPEFEPPVVPIQRLTDDLARRWRFDRRHLNGGPVGDVRKILAERTGL